MQRSAIKNNLDLRHCKDSNELTLPTKQPPINYSTQ